MYKRQNLLDFTTLVDVSLEVQLSSPSSSGRGRITLRCALTGLQEQEQNRSLIHSQCNDSSTVPLFRQLWCVSQLMPGSEPPPTMDRTDIATSRKLSPEGTSQGDREMMSWSLAYASRILHTRKKSKGKRKFTFQVRAFITSYFFP